jgi:hypothetical protein
MSAIPNARSIADAMAANAASYVLIAPPDCRDAAIASVAAGFRDACIEHGIPVEAEDTAYYVKLVTAKVAEMTPRLVVHHSDFDVLIPSHSRIGKVSGGTRITMLLGTPG